MSFSFGFDWRRRRPMPAGSTDASNGRRRPKGSSLLRYNRRGRKNSKQRQSLVLAAQDSFRPICSRGHSQEELTSSLCFVRSRGTETGHHNILGTISIVVLLPDRSNYRFVFSTVSRRPTSSPAGSSSSPSFFFLSFPSLDGSSSDWSGLSVFFDLNMGCERVPTNQHSFPGSSRSFSLSLSSHLVLLVLSKD